MSALGAGEREDRRAYVQALAEYARDDARQVYVRVTAALAVATLFVTQLPFGNLQRLNNWWTGTLFAGLICLIAAAFLYFLYVGASHHARREIAAHFLNLECVERYPTPEDAAPGEPEVGEKRYPAIGLSDFVCAVGGRNRRTP